MWCKVQVSKSLHFTKSPRFCFYSQLFRKIENIQGSFAASQYEFSKISHVVKYREPQPFTVTNDLSINYRSACFHREEVLHVTNTPSLLRLRVRVRLVRVLVLVFALLLCQRGTPRHTAQHTVKFQLVNKR